MNVRRLLVLSILAIVFGCQGHELPTAPGTVKNVPLGSSAVLSDGANGGNPDFFFLPPLVPAPYTNPAFEVGRSNNVLRPNLVVQICELRPEYTDKGRQENEDGARRGREEENSRDGKGKVTAPKAGTACVSGAPLKKFAAGSVQLVENPATQNGWWRAFTMPADGFFYVLWDTRRVELKEKKYYRIKVLVDGSSDPLGYADINETENSRLAYTQTGGVIHVVDDVLLPIPFRVEQGALCGGSTSCTTTVVTNDAPGGSQTVTVDGGLGEAVAGAKFPNGWLPEGGPQSVVVTISQVNTGVNNRQAGTQEIPCHSGLPLQQFDACYKFTTTPTLAFIGNTRKQFAKSVTVAVCYVLEGSGDPREKFAEMYASGPNEPAHQLTDVDDFGILSPLVRNCTSTGPVGSASPMMHLASAGWRKLKAGLGYVFSVKTAYAVDGGLGGLLDAFSNVGPALTAHMERSTIFGRKLAYGEVRPSLVRITGSNQHNLVEGVPSPRGIDSVAVTFTVASGNGGLNFTENTGTATQLTVNSKTRPFPVSGASGAGLAEIAWTMPSAPGIYTLTATSRALGGPITFADTVRGARTMLSMQAGATYQIPVVAPVVNTWLSSNPSKVTVSSGGLVTAIVGGDDINGGNSVTLTSTRPGGIEAHSALVNSFSFDVYPRHTTAVWVAVPGAVTYRVFAQNAQGCPDNVPGTCWINNFGSPATVAGSLSSYTFDFVGAQQGRWRMEALNGDGGVIGESPYIYFRYNI
jgi:hypothetical protein